MEADTKQVNSIIEDLGLTESKDASTPGVKDRVENVQQEKEKQLEQEEKNEVDDCDMCMIAQERRKLTKAKEQAEIEVEEEKVPFDLEIDVSQSLIGGGEISLLSSISRERSQDSEKCS